MPGLVLRVAPSGKQTWLVTYKRHGRGRRFTIGQLPYMELAAAREEARRVRSRVGLGQDPQRERQEERRRASLAQLTVERMVRDFLASPQYAKLRPQTRESYGRLAEVEIIEPLSHHPAAGLPRDLIRQWSERLATRAPAVALHSFNLLRRIYNWAKNDAELLDASPFDKKLPAPAEVEKSDRVLSTAQIRADLAVGDPQPPPYRRDASNEDLGVRDDVVSALLAHVPCGLADATPIYLRAHLLAERRAALVAWGAWLEQLASDAVSAAPKVVPIR